MCLKYVQSFGGETELYKCCCKPINSSGRIACIYRRVVLLTWKENYYTTVYSLKTIEPQREAFH